MRIYQLEIKNFRGIKDSTFKFTTPLVCLIGLGDSTKSTILDAIEYVLSPNWFLPIDDSDFTNGDVTTNIEITITIGPIDEQSGWRSDTKYGQHLRIWNIGTAELIDEREPQANDIYVLSIKLTIDETLAPDWKVITNRTPDGANIPYRDRQKCEVSRIGHLVDNELAWMRGSSLLSMLKDKKEVEKTLLAANRKLREMDLPPDTFAALQDSIQRAKANGRTYGIHTEHLKAHIDPKSLRGNVGTVSLHNGNVPFRRMGLGTRRLMAIGLQLASIESEGTILLIDEIEQALEPHRLKHLLRMLTKNRGETNYGQLFMTTHSPAVLEELGSEGVYCVHYKSENTSSIATHIRNETQGTMRRIPEAFLSPKVIVCEGQTEEGLLRAFEKSEIEKKGSEVSFAYNKTVIVNGEGSSSAPERAYHLALNDYSACLFIDSDELQQWKINEAQLLTTGVKVVRWKDTYNTEMQLCADLPLECFKDLITIAIDVTGRTEHAILDSIRTGLSARIGSLEELEGAISDEAAFRTAVAKAACQAGTGWFKNISKAETLGAFLFEKIHENIKVTHFYKQFEAIQKWARNEQ